MTHGGHNLEKWDVKLISQEMRTHFVVCMLKQIIPGLKKLHHMGYSHNDLKPANICARQNDDK